MKKLFLFVAVTALIVAASAGSAFANYGIHGGYLSDTDACAGCHRAHTAVDQLTWQDNDGFARNPLLVSSAATYREFCYTCHGNDAPGASTNVQGGVFDTAILGNNQSAEDKVLNGGGFEWMGYNNTTVTVVTATHVLETSGALMWGSGTSSVGTYGKFSCNSCHDVHGSSNYRILRDQVNGKTVGGYGAVDLSSANNVANPAPTPWVMSSEVGYPNGSGLGGTADSGFKLHKQYPGYQPDYTTAVYHVPPNRNMTGGSLVAGDPLSQGMTGWCIACHEQYGDRGIVGNNTSPVYDAGDGVTGKARHRHPVNTPLSAFNGPRGLVFNPYTWYDGWANPDPAIGMLAAGDATGIPEFVDLPLLHDATQENAEGAYQGANAINGGITYSIEDGLDCLTCHRAHGADTMMDGYADNDAGLIPPGAVYGVVGDLVIDPNSFAGGSGLGGVAPTFNNSLLRADNRGVCERCHNK